MTLTDFALLLVKRAQSLLLVILAVMVGILSFQTRRDERRIQELSVQAGNLPAGTAQIVTVYRDRVVTRTQVLPGKVEYRDRYLPPEGSVELYIRKDGLANDRQPEVKDYGFTCRLGGGLVYAGALLPQADIKWFYFRRYSVLTGITPQFMTISLSRHVDDVIPLQNAEIGGHIGVSWDGRIKLAFGIRTNL